MSFQDLGSIGEFIAAIATLGTLIYLATQIRQNTESIRSTAEINVSQTMSEWASRAWSDSDVLRIYDQAAVDPASLNNDEARKFLWFICELFLIFEGHYHLYRKGDITPGSWRAKSDLLVGLLKNPLVRGWWDDRSAPFSETFFTYIESIKHGDSGWQNKPIVK